MNQNLLNKLKFNSPKIKILLLILVVTTFIIPKHSNSQIISISILDLRTKIKNHKWTFHPGDSPVLTDQNKKDYEEYDENEEEILENKKNNISNKTTHFAWAQPILNQDDSKGWISDIEIQRSWMRYRDKNNKRIFKNFHEYYKTYKGYSWYRTEFKIEKNDLKKKFKSKNLILRLGKIGQADAVYINGQFIGGTGLKHNTPENSILADKKLFYDKTRYYEIPMHLIDFNKANVLAVRVFSKYPIAPGLSHGKYYIASTKKIERSKFWDNFKKIFVMVLTTLLGVFYIYWQILFRENDRASIYFALTCFTMAVNTFMQSQIVYSMIENAFWIKKFEFISFIIFLHLVLEFFVHFTKMESKTITLTNRIWDILGVAAVIIMLFMPNLIIARRFMFVWSAAPALAIAYLIFIMIKGKEVPSITSVSIGFIGMAIMLFNDVLVGFQYRWVLWEFSMKDYAFAFFGIMSATSIVSNMKKSRELILKQKEEKEKLSKFFSPDVIDEILDGELSLGGQERQITTLFADIVGFTSYSETQPPGKVLERLNEMFTEMSEVIIEHKATLDKYIGDCVMAFWGAPKPTPDDAYNAISCAMEMQKVCDRLTKDLNEGELPFRLRIGINQGPSIAGYIGSHERMDYSVIGDAVNTASRIESNGIPGKVAISESTFQSAGGDEFIKYSETREITVKGKSEPLKIYIVDEIVKKN